MSRYHRRSERLSDTRAEIFRREIGECRSRLIPFLIELKVQSQAYLAIVNIIQALERAEIEATGKSPEWTLGHSTTGHRQE